MPKFELENKRLLRLTLENEKAMTLTGAMVAYEGTIKFEKSTFGGEGLFGALKRTVAGESLNLMVTSGAGVVYVAHEAREICVIPLEGDKLMVESRSLIAYDMGLKTSTAFTGLRGAATGQGLFTTTIEGKGSVCLMSDGTMIALEVTPDQPLCVDPDAYLASKGGLRQEFVFDVNWKTLLGHSGGESYQLKFTGNGIVYIQPSERK